MPIPTPEPALVISYAYLWPGYDLRKAPGADRYEFGFLPPRFFKRVVEAFERLRAIGKAHLTSRE